MTRTSLFTITPNNIDSIDYFVRHIQKPKIIPIIVVESNQPLNYFTKGNGYTEYINFNLGAKFQYVNNGNIVYILIKQTSYCYGDKNIYYYIKGNEHLIQE